MRGEVGEYPALGDEGEYPPMPAPLNGDVGEVLNGLVAPKFAYGLIVPLPAKPPPYSVPNPAGVSDPAPWMGEKFPAAGELRLM